MTAIKRSRLVLLCMLLASASLIGLFALIHASSANASLDKGTPPAHSIQPNLVITPTQLQASLNLNEQLTRTLIITNTTANPITYTIYEMTSVVKATGTILQPAVTPVVDPEAQAQVDSHGKTMVILTLR